MDRRLGPGGGARSPRQRGLSSAHAQTSTACTTRPAGVPPDGRFPASRRLDRPGKEARLHGNLPLRPEAQRRPAGSDRPLDRAHLHAEQQEIRAGPRVDPQLARGHPRGPRAAAADDRAHRGGVQVGHRRRGEHLLLRPRSDEHGAGRRQPQGDRDLEGRPDRHRGARGQGQGPHHRRLHAPARRQDAARGLAPRARLAAAAARRAPGFRAACPAQYARSSRSAGSSRPFGE